MKIFWLFATIIILSSVLTAQHPKLVLTQDAVQSMKEALGKYPLFDSSFEKVKKDIDDALIIKMDVPVPSDAGGGYTHEKHKKNYTEMYLAGILYQVTGNIKYAAFIKNMLDKYAELYPGLGLHPQAKDQTPGRLFWQSLNETVWLLHTIQAYDCIYNWLPQSDRLKYEKNIFYPMVKFFVEDSEHEFNLIHNHGTWMLACVGMTGYVLNNQELIEKALHGSKKNDEGGFLPQLNLLFSPDGYYTEGGYYARYALWPFFIFAEVIHNNQPELKIYEYRDQILKKAFYSALQMTYTNGEFMPINDALKEKTFLSPEIVFALNFVYAHYGKDEELLSIAEKQGEVTLTGPGLMIAKDHNSITKVPEFNWRSIEFRDGAKGDEGGVGVLRWGPVKDKETLLFKYTSHGLSHGHFDKLTYLFYDQGREIIQDYGSSRFLNVVQKQGGRYLPENKSFAMQTVAHNTVVVDQKTQFKGNRKLSEANHSDRYAFNCTDPNFQYASAKENNAYEGVRMHRTMVMVNDEKITRPVILDVYRIDSEQEHVYDLPFYYMGHFVYSGIKYEPFIKQRTVMGESEGYEHLWNEAVIQPDTSKQNSKGSTAQFTWWNGERFYSITSKAEDTKIYFIRTGASDPEFNLRSDPGLMLRKKAKNHIFVNIIEPHGVFDPTLEYTFGSYSNFKDINVAFSDDEYTIINITGENSINWDLMIANKDSEENNTHTHKSGNKNYTWKGPVAINKIRS